MRLLLTESVGILGLSASTAAFAGTAPPGANSLNMPSYQEPAKNWRDLDEPIERERCNEMIRQVRSEAGKTDLELKRRTPPPEDALLIAAVDQNLDGCKVLVMKRDTSDIRPVPEPQNGSLKIDKID